MVRCVVPGCGSYAVNGHSTGRAWGDHTDYEDAQCDRCYWMLKYDALQARVLSQAEVPGGDSAAPPDDFDPTPIDDRR